MRIFRLTVLVVVSVMWGTAASAQSPNCSGAVPDDNNDDSSAINSCLSGGGTVMLANGLYWIDATLNLTQDNTVFIGEVVEGIAPILRARPELDETMLVVSASADNWEIYNLAFDGNDSNRTDLEACDGYRGWATNIQARGTGFSIHHISSNSALCGSALEVEGSDFDIYNSEFLYNGSNSGANEPWADGITLLMCDVGSVYSNYFRDNTDIDIVVGGGDECLIDDNEIDHVDDYAFAGFHVGWFPGTFAAAHDTSEYRYFDISSASDKLGFGVVVGYHPWSSTRDIEGGYVHHNYSNGANINLLVEGITSGSFQSNTWDNPQGSACGVNYDYAAYHHSGATIQNGATSYERHSVCGVP